MKKTNIHSKLHLKFENFNKILIFSALILFCSLSLFSQKNASSFTRNISILNSNIQISISNKQHTVKIKDWAKTTEIGTPELPIKYELVYIPQNCEASIDFHIHKSRRINGVNLTKSLPQQIDTEELPPFNPDSIPSYPIIDAWFFNSPVSIDRIIEFRGHKMALIKLSPIQYNPFRKTLIINTNFDYSIHFKQKANKINSDRSPKISIKDIHSLKRWVVNPESITLLYSNKQQNTFSNYLIISSSNYSVAADSLALWKQECGYKTKIISKQLWTSALIKDTIQYYYNSIDLCPDYVCFLGDHNFVSGTEKLAPPPLPDMFATDLYYVCMDGVNDYFPDIAYGRISVSNSSEALTTVKKIINYEKSPPQNASFYQNASHCAYFQDETLDGFDDRRFVQTSEEIRDYIQQNTDIQVQRIYEANSDVNPQFWNNGLYSAGESIPAELLKPNFAWNGSTSNVINSMNYGRLYVFHRDHGYSNATGWAHPSFVSSQIQYLFNLNQLPLILSINCHTGEFTKPECFAEKMLRLPTGGCFGIFAPSFYSYSGYNDAFSLGIIDGFWNNPGINPNFTGSGGTPTPDFDNAMSSNKPGDILIHSLIYSTLHWGFNQHTNEVMHYFGDPATTFYTSLPEPITAYISDTIFCNSESYFIQTQNCTNCIASISLHNQLVASSQIINDTLSLHFNPMYGDTAYITITGSGKRPLIKALTWLCNQPVYAPISDFSVNDSIACNGVIQFTDQSLHFPQQWFWNFGDGNYSNLQNPTHNYNSPGYYTVKLKTLNIHGEDSIFKINIIHVITPDAPIFSDTLLCNPSELTLAAFASQQVYWYSDMERQNLIGTGLNYYFNNLTQDTNIYPFTKNIISNLPLGIRNNSGIGGYIYNTKKNYLVFHTFDDFTLISVKVFSNTTGNKIIELSDSAGNVITNKVFNFSIGENIVPLNFIIQKDKRYRLIGPTYSNFHATNVDVQFPYTLQNVLSIDSSSSLNPLDTYYYFYDWNISRLCFSNPDTLTVRVQHIDPNISPSGKYILCSDLSSFTISTNSGMEANWSNGVVAQSINTSQAGSYSAYFSLNSCIYFSDTLQLLPYSAINTSFSINCLNNHCEFSNTSLNAIWYVWDFGDGTYSNEANPTHIFADTGIYNVQLMAYTNCDTAYYNQSIMVDALSVCESGLPNISVYPNPMSDGFYVLNSNCHNSSFILYNSNGQIIWQKSDNKEKIFIDMKPYSSGMYFIEIRTSTDVVRLKLLKITEL